MAIFLIERSPFLALSRTLLFLNANRLLLSGVIVRSSGAALGWRDEFHSLIKVLIYETLSSQARFVRSCFDEINEFRQIPRSE